MNKIILIALFSITFNICSSQSIDSPLIEKLKKVYEEYLETKEGKINLDILKKTLFLKKGTISEDKPKVPKDTLNTEQFQAVKSSLGSDIVYIWGPPGTGKTHCISKVIEAFYYEKKKVLLVSNTNVPKTSSPTHKL